jgi:hypothetical protein
MRFRKLRIAWSVVCGIACVVLIVLWVRSYWRCDSLDIAGAHQMTSLRGMCFIDGNIRKSETKVVGAVYGLTWYQHFDRFAPDGIVPLSKGTAIPIWLLILLVMAISAAGWKSWSNRFSLRTVLNAMTLLALLLGLVVYATR